MTTICTSCSVNPDNNSPNATVVRLVAFLLVSIFIVSCQAQVEPQRNTPNDARARAGDGRLKEAKLSEEVSIVMLGNATFEEGRLNVGGR